MNKKDQTNNQQPKDIENGNKQEHHIYMSNSNPDKCIIKSNNNQQKDKDIPFIKLFRYATKYDYFLITVGIIASAGNGILMPLFSLVFGEMTDSFSPKSTPDTVVQSAGNQALNFLYLGLASFALSFVRKKKN